MTTVETRNFDAEVGKVLQLMIHSLYTNRDIFLRELISNASDACDKLRYLAQTDSAMLQGHGGFRITIRVDKEARTLSIEDSGIGMSKEDMIDHLGTIARSGTQKFLEQMTGDRQHDASLIGQFGVGFYSSFMVADKVDVYSRKAKEEEVWHWASTGDGTFTIAPATAPRDVGTTVVLHLKPSEDEFLDLFRIRHIVKTYSDHIAVPVELADKEGKTEVVNSSSALWTRNKSEITPEEYQQFYKNIAFAGDEPWMILHNKNEGITEFTNLLYIPTSKPFDLFYPDRRTRVKLYIKRVFINDEGVNIVPAWLRFLRGVVDAQDLPLNISRETLQQNHTVEKIRKAIVKRVLGELKKKANEDTASYEGFWENFGPVLKEGLCEPSEHREALLEVCRFHSTHGEGLVSLEDYVARMQPGQNRIYFLTGDSLEKIRNSPQLEGFRSKNIEVLLFTDSVDDFWVNVVHEFKEKALCSVTRADAAEEEGSETEAKEKKTEKPELSKEDTDVLTYLQEALKGKVQDVIASHKLVDSPSCLAVAEGGMDMRMERFLLDQKQIAVGSLKLLEVNLQHPILKHLAETYAKDATTAQDLALLLFEQACVLEGEALPDPAGFTKRLNARILKGF